MSMVQNLVYFLLTFVSKTKDSSPDTEKEEMELSIYIAFLGFLQTLIEMKYFSHCQCRVWAFDSMSEEKPVSLLSFQESILRIWYMWNY